MTPGEARRPWERQPGETKKAFRAFAAYRDAGPTRQKLPTYRELYDRPNASATPGFFARWARENQWDERAEAWDECVDRRHQEKLLEDAEARAVLHIRQARAMQLKALEALESMDPAKLTARDIRDWLETGQQLERLAIGEATQIIERGPGGQPQSVTQVMNLLVGAMQEDPGLAREIQNVSDEELPKLIETHFGVDVARLWRN